MFFAGPVRSLVRFVVRFRVRSLVRFPVRFPVRFVVRSLVRSLVRFLVRSLVRFLVRARVRSSCSLSSSPSLLSPPPQTMTITTDGTAQKIGFKNAKDKAYLNYVRIVKTEFIRRDHLEILPGPHALKESGTLVAWEAGLNSLYEKYPERWGPERFSDLGERRNYANFFLVAQTKKARSDINIAKNKKEAEEKAKKEAEEKARKESEAKGKKKVAAKRPLPYDDTVQKVRGRKRPRDDSDPNSFQSSPPGPSTFVRYSTASRHSSPSHHLQRYNFTRPSPLPQPQRETKSDRPELKFKSFVVLLKVKQFSQASYDLLWKFEGLHEWILAKAPTLSGQSILCWSDLTIRNAEFAELREHELKEKVPFFISDQSSWDAAVMAAQINRMTADEFSGISLKVTLATDPSAPPHSEGDIIVPERTETGGGTGDRDAPKAPEVVVVGDDDDEEEEEDTEGILGELNEFEKLWEQDDDVARSSEEEEPPAAAAGPSNPSKR